MGTRRLDQMPPQSNFAGLLGVEIVKVTPEEVICRMRVTEAMANRNGVLHGGAMMTLADNAAGSAAFINSDMDHTNTTVEAKTNFMRAVKVGDVLTARCVPLQTGRRIQVLQVTVTRADGKVAAVTTQTHLVLEWDG